MGSILKIFSNYDDDFGDYGEYKNYKDYGYGEYDDGYEHEKRKNKRNVQESLDPEIENIKKPKLRKAAIITGGSVLAGIGTFAGARRGMLGARTAMSANKLWGNWGVNMGSNRMIEDAAKRYGKFDAKFKAKMAKNGILNKKGETIAAKINGSFRDIGTELTQAELDEIAKKSEQNMLKKARIEAKVRTAQKNGVKGQELKDVRSRAVEEEYATEIAEGRSRRAATSGGNSGSSSGHTTGSSGYGPWGSYEEFEEWLRNSPNEGSRPSWDFDMFD